MKEYLTTLRLNDVEDLKERVLGSVAFLTCWPVYRDEYFWSDDRQVGTRGNNEPTISARVVAELGLRNKSRYAYGIAGPAFRLNWTPLDYDIWLYSQLISMLGTPGCSSQGHGKVERGHRWGSAKAERGHRWSHRKKVGGVTLLSIQNAHRQPYLT